MTPIAKGTPAWAIDAMHAEVGFAVKHLMISTVRGRFGAVAGNVLARRGKSGEVDSRRHGRRRIDRHAPGDAGQSPPLARLLRRGELPDDAIREQAASRATFGEEVPCRRRPDHSRRHARSHARRRRTREARKDPWGNDRVGISAYGEAQSRRLRSDVESGARDRRRRGWRRGQAVDRRRADSRKSHR